MFFFFFGQVSFIIIFVIIHVNNNLYKAYGGIQTRRHFISPSFIPGSTSINHRSGPQTTLLKTHDDVIPSLDTLIDDVTNGLSGYIN